VSTSSDNFTALIYLKDQVRKWKNLAFFIAIITLLLLSRSFFSKDTDLKEDIDGNGEYIANISIEGIILDDTYRENILKKIASQKNIKAVIVNINSPGGGIVGSEILYEKLREISAKKPIVAVMGSLAASGGYMTAIASDYIIARNGTLTGSVGVIMQSSEVTDLAKKLGVKFISYKSSPLKGAPSPFEKANPAVDKVINESIMDSYEFFSGLVLERRKDKINKKEIDHIIDGRIFTGRQALKAGLVDEIGGDVEALNYLKKNYHIDTDKIEVRDISLKENESKFFEKILGGESLAKVLSMYPRKNLMAIWGE
jgi:protease IV